MTDEMFTELLPGLVFVEGERKGRFPYSNALLITAGDKRVLVDAGYGPSRCERIRESGAIDIIINTHFHLDHAYGNKFFPEAEVWTHTLDAPAIRSLDMFKAFTGSQDVLDMPDSKLYPDGPTTSEVTRELKDGEVLTFGELNFQVIHTPGHTRGHITLFEQQANLLFSGDIDLSPFGPWYGDVCSDLEDFLNSIKRVLELNPQVLVSSHKGIIRENIPQRLKEFAAKIEERDQQILSFLQAPKKAEDLIGQKIIYARYPEPQQSYLFFERIMLEKHLKRLAKQGRVVSRPNGLFKACG